MAGGRLFLESYGVWDFVEKPVVRCIHHKESPVIERHSDTRKNVIEGFCRDCLFAVHESARQLGAAPVALTYYAMYWRKNGEKEPFYVDRNRRV